MVGPTDAHSCAFSGYSAGYEDEPGRVMPRASAQEAIVFAVYERVRKIIESMQPRDDSDLYSE